MVKFLTLLFTLIVSIPSFAGSYDVFMDSFKEEYYINKTTRGKELHYQTRVTPFNWLMRKLSPDAVATYNDKINLVSLNDELIVREGAWASIKDVRTIQGPSFSSYKTATIFHEMGHAELDVFIENETEPMDSELYNYYRFVLKDFYKKYFPGFNPLTVFHEHFGYYRGELIEKIGSEIDNVLLMNGFNRNKNVCFITKPLKELVLGGMHVTEFKKILAFHATETYRGQIGPNYLFVKGKDIDLRAKHVPQKVMKTIEFMFWSYHRTFYDFPGGQADLIRRMNERAHFRHTLAKCREKLWYRIKEGKI